MRREKREASAILSDPGSLPGFAHFYAFLALASLSLLRRRHHLSLYPLALLPLVHQDPCTSERRRRRGTQERDESRVKKFVSLRPSQGNCERMSDPFLGSLAPLLLQRSSTLKKALSLSLSHPRSDRSQCMTLPVSLSARVCVCASVPAAAAKGEERSGRAQQRRSQ